MTRTMKTLILAASFILSSVFLYAFETHVDKFPPSIAMHSPSASADTGAHHAPLMLLADTAAPVATDGGGSASGSGSASAAPAPAPTIHDPSQDPAAYGHDVLTAYKAGQWLFFGVLIAFGLDALLVYGAKKWPTSALGKLITPLTLAGTALLGIATAIVPGVSPDYKKIVAMVIGALLTYLTATSAKTPAAASA